MKRLTVQQRLQKVLNEHPGPWEIESYSHTCHAGIRRPMWTIYDRWTDLCDTASQEQAEFIAGLRELISDAIDEIEQLRAKTAGEQVEL